jgi:hypothetical protein
MVNVTKSVSLYVPAIDRLDLNPYVNGQTEYKIWKRFLSGLTSGNTTASWRFLSSGVKCLVVRETTFWRNITLCHQNRKISYVGNQNEAGCKHSQQEIMNWTIANVPHKYLRERNFDSLFSIFDLRHISERLTNYILYNDFSVHSGNKVWRCFYFDVHFSINFVRLTEILSSWR